MKRFFQIFVSALLVAAIVASVAWYLLVFDRDFTRDILLQQARYHDLHGNARISSMFYNLAYTHTGKDENVAIELANQYKADGNYTKAEVTLSNAINSEPTKELYIALCKTFVEQDKLLDASALLANISDPILKAELDAMTPAAPTADYAPGFYSQYITLSLTADAPTIYYSTDGEYPSIADGAYEGPIALPKGETQICAIAVAENGLVSPFSRMGYTVGGIIEPAVFVDPAIEPVIRELLGFDEDKVIYTDDLWTITEFTVPAGLQTLEDLKLMTYLEKLTISDYNISSLEPLSSLLQLNTLEISGCRFPAANLAYIAGLPNLVNLTISDSGLSTISELAAATRLTDLDLSGNTVRNLDALAGMKSLVRLNLQHNAVTGLEVLGGLTNLESLDISHNAVSSLEPLRSCVKLSTLLANNNQLTSAAGVDSLTVLSTLNLDYNQLESIREVGSCLHLTELRLSNNNVTDLSDLALLTQLDILDFSYNSVTALPEWPAETALRVIDGSYNKLESIDILGSLGDVTYVYMDYNSLTNVDALANCFHLVQVNVYGNEIEDVSKLTAHNIIVNYNPT